MHSCYCIMAPAQASRAAAGATDGRRSAVKDTVKIYSQNSRGLRAAALEEVLATMKKEEVFVWALQETWRLNTEEHHHEDGYVTINHGPKEKLCRRGSLGVMLVLSPAAVEAYVRGGNKRRAYGLRVLAVDLVLLDEKDKVVKMRIVSAYAPTSQATVEQKENYEMHLTRAIEDNEEDSVLIIGSDVNASCGRDTAMLHNIMNTPGFQSPGDGAQSPGDHADDDDDVQSPVGPHGINWRNKAGDELLAFLALRNMCLPTSFFEKKMSRRATWYNPRSKRPYELDHFMMRRQDLKRVVDAGTKRRHSVYSDHTAIFLKVRIARGLAKQKERNPESFSRDRLQDAETRGKFIEVVEQHLLDLDSRLLSRRNDGWKLRKDQKDGSTQGALQDAFKAAETACSTVEAKRNPGWFRMSQEKLLCSIRRRNALQHDYNKAAARAAVAGRMSTCRFQTRQNQSAQINKHERARDDSGKAIPHDEGGKGMDLLRERRQKRARQERTRQLEAQAKKVKLSLRHHQQQHKRLVRAAKRKWNVDRIRKVNKNGGAFVGDCWKAAKEIGGQDDKRRRYNLDFRDPTTGEQATSAKRSGEVLVAHLDKLLNAEPAVDDGALERVRRRVMQWGFDDAPDIKEIEMATRRQNSGKATGDSKIPAEYFKLCLDSEPIVRVLEIIITRAWNGIEVPKEWVEGRIKMLPKSGDLLDPGRWRSITLLDAASKIMSTILTLRLNKILETEGIEAQNGFSPGRGTTDGSFCVRTMLKKRREHGQETWAYFLDLVKAFDTVPRKALLKVLGKFGVPPKMVAMIDNMYSGCTVKLELDTGDPLRAREDAIIKATAGVKQGDNLAPVLFLIYIQAVLEGLDDAFAEAGEERSTPIFCTKNDHIICGRRWCHKTGTARFTASESLYADDAAFLCTSRASLEKSAVIIDRHFSKFGLQVHRGRDGKKSKTECMFFPAPGKRYEDADTSNVPVDNGYYTFTRKFKYLGSIITTDLKADTDIATRIRSAAGAFNTMRHVLRSRRVRPKEKGEIYMAIVGSILLYGSECWAIRNDLMEKLERFHNQCVRAMCHVTRREQWFKHIRNDDLQKRLGVPSAAEMVTRRMLRWAGHVARMPEERLPRKLLTGWVEHPRPHGRPEQTFGHALDKALKLRAKQIRKLHPLININININTDNTNNGNNPNPDNTYWHDLTDQLCRVRTLRRGLPASTKTWIDAAQDRVLWKQIVYQRF